MTEEEVTSREIVVMRAVASMEERVLCPNVTAVAKMFGAPNAQVQRLLERAVSKGMLREEKGEHGRARRYFVTTDKGRELLGSRSAKQKKDVRDLAKAVEAVTAKVEGLTKAVRRLESKLRASE